MGCDLITHSIMVPYKGFSSILASEIKRLECGLSAAKCNKDIDAMGVDRNAMGVDRNNPQYEEVEYHDLVKLIKKDIAELKKIKNTDDLTAGRDTNWHQFEVNNYQVMCVYAGDMSFGDDPDGYGYNLLGIILRLGIEVAFYNAIPWQCKWHGKDS